MMGNGLANIIAAVIVAGALIWTGGLGKDRSSHTQTSALTQEQQAEWIARAVGDIRNDIVVNCGCCGDDDGRRANGNSF